MGSIWHYNGFMMIVKGYDYKLTNKVLDAMMIGGDADHGAIYLPRMHELFQPNSRIRGYC